MTADVESPPALDDVFLHDHPLPLRATLFPLGLPLQIATNSEAVLAAARESWGMFAPADPATPVSLHLTVTDDGEELPPRPKFRAHRHLMSIVADARNQVMCDFSRACAFGWVTRRVAGDAEFLRLHFLEAAVMTMLVEAHLAPIHSGLVLRRGTGVALCGETFSGKSTLAYACARAGWTFVADDGTFLLRSRPGRIALGNPYSLRLREDAKALFPELAKLRVGLRPNGERGIEVPTADMRVATSCAIDQIVFLRRSRSGPAEIRRFDPAKALQWVERTAFYGPAAVQAAQRQAYRGLLEAGLWELHYSSLSGAVELLNQL